MDVHRSFQPAFYWFARGLSMACIEGSSIAQVLATDYSHETKPGTTARTKEESVCVRRTRLGQVYK